MLSVGDVRFSAYRVEGSVLRDGGRLSVGDVKVQCTGSGRISARGCGSTVLGNLEGSVFGDVEGSVLRDGGRLSFGDVEFQCIGSGRLSARGCGSSVRAWDCGDLE
jgi:hypothetical protein